MHDHDARYDIQIYMSDGFVHYDIDYGRYRISAYEDSGKWQGYVGLGIHSILEDPCERDTLNDIFTDGMTYADMHRSAGRLINRHYEWESEIRQLLHIRQGSAILYLDETTSFLDSKGYVWSSEEEEWIKRP